MAWRSAALRFVNFTGTAGVWRASAIEAAGGWRAESLVEDGELSFRVLFAGYRTKFVKEIVVPAELPATYTAYKAQQKRWAQGWAQVQRLHLCTLLFGHSTSWLRRLQLFYMMCISWQWPLWAAWLMVLPFAVLGGHWLGALGPGWGVAAYLLPSALWLAVSATITALATRYTYPGPLTPSRFVGRLARVVPLAAVSTGMLAHQVSAFGQGLFGPLRSEFERTPKTASVTRPDLPPAPPAAHGAAVARKVDQVKVHWPFVIAEVFLIAYQLTWALLFAGAGNTWGAVAATAVAVCAIYLVFFDGDQAGRRWFVVDRDRLVSRATNRLTAGVLGLVATMLVVSSVIGQLSTYLLASPVPAGLASAFYVDTERNIPTFFSVALLLIAAALLAAIAKRNRKQGLPYVSAWAVLAVGFVLMAVDEAFEIHERLNLPIGELLGDRPLGAFYYPWVIPAIALVAVLGLFFVRFLRHLPGTIRLRFLLAAMLYLGGAIGVELVGSQYAEGHGTATWTYSLIATLEESLELAGLVAFIWALLDYTGTAVGSRLGVGVDEPRTRRDSDRYPLAAP
jgi:hypothetical protein